MSKKLTLICIVALLLVLPAAVNAKRPKLTATLTDLQYVDLGVTSLKQTTDGLKVKTRGLRAVGLIACNGDSLCDAAGLDGRRVGMKQVCRLDIDSSSAGFMPLTGRCGAEISVLNQEDTPVGPRLRFKGQITGYGGYFGGEGQTGTFYLDFAGKTRNKGTMVFSTSGTLSTVGGNVTWQDLAFEGDAVISIIADFPPGRGFTANG